ncbi:MAG TPA: hypothetical protein VEG63_05425 [Candidatus Acidoferrales bacterium]|nr:hypothetical protein [Candidatus Acidoferrales bacterium]
MLKNSRIFALVASAAALALAFPSVCAAQAAPPTSDGQRVPTPATPAPTVSSSPTVTVNATPNTNVKVAKPKMVKYKGRVLAFNIATVIVQSMANPRMVWSFQYSTDLHNRVADMLGTGGYQPGDMITVYCNPGTSVAVKLKGKPSKSS